MKIEQKYVTYAFTGSLLVLSAAFKSSTFAFAACVSFGMGLVKEYMDQMFEARSGKGADALLRHKVEQLEAALSAIVSREKARGW